MNKKNILIFALVLVVLSSSTYGFIDPTEWALINYSDAISAIGITPASGSFNGLVTNETTGNLPSSWWISYKNIIYELDKNFGLVSSFDVTPFVGASGIRGLMINASETAVNTFFTNEPNGTKNQIFRAFNSTPAQLWNQSLKVPANHCVGQPVTNITNDNITSFFCVDSSPRNKLYQLDFNGDVVTNVSIDGNCTSPISVWTNASNRAVTDFWIGCATTAQLAHYSFNETDLTFIEFEGVSNITGITGNNLLQGMTSNVRNQEIKSWWVFYDNRPLIELYKITKDNLLDDCSDFDSTALIIFGKDEETDNNVNMSLDLTFFIKSPVEQSISFSLTGSNNYTFCSHPLGDITFDAIMEYGDGTIYTDRKYYLNNFTINPTTISEVFLYHLNDSKASEIVFTVFDITTGDRVQGAFIKILRFYPGENVLRIIEIAKTDEVGQTLGKMVLADVFYKFIIESPAGTVKLDTGVLRILSLTRSFGISFVEDVLATWDKIHGVSYSTTCTKGTKTCRVTWSDTSNIVQSVTLEVWRVTGLADTLLSSQTTTAAAGTISYTIVEDTLTNTYEARVFSRSTNPSDWSFGRASFFDSDNPFFTDQANRLASLFPLFLLVVVILFALIDWGVVGIVIGSLLGMIIGSITGMLPISYFYLISVVLKGVILIYKLSK